MIRIGSLHCKLANVDEELHMYNQALTTYTKALGEKHSYVEGTRKILGWFLRSDLIITQQWSNLTGVFDLFAY